MARDESAAQGKGRIKYPMICIHCGAGQENHALVLDHWFEPERESEAELQNKLIKAIREMYEAYGIYD